MSGQKERILEAMQATGACSIQTLARHCIQNDVFTEEELAVARQQWACRKVREALKSRDENDLPIAGQTTQTDGDGDAIWAERELWNAGDYQLNIEENVRNARSNYEVAKRLRFECLERHGVAWNIDTYPVQSEPALA